MKNLLYIILLIGITINITGCKSNDLYLPPVKYSKIIEPPVKYLEFSYF